MSADGGRTPVIAFVALGSNLGDRRAMLRLARQAIDMIGETHIVAESDIEETAPLGPPGQPAYLNQMLAVSTMLPARTFLESLLDIERQAGRVRSERWGARTLDCDIVRFGTLVIDEPGLTLPHPALPDRDFWQRELAQVESALGTSVGAAG